MIFYLADWLKKGPNLKGFWSISVSISIY